MGNISAPNPFREGGYDLELQVARDLIDEDRTIRLDQPGLPDVLDDVLLQVYQWIWSKCLGQESERSLDTI